MGTLDDAIREHLELKKRSGASEEEVKRLESEAFGPIRREAAAPAPEPAAAAASEPDAEPVEPTESAEAAEPATTVQRVEEAPIFDAAPAEAEAAPEPEVQPHREPAQTAEETPARSWLEDEQDRPDQTREFSATEASDATGAVAAGDYVAPDEEGDDLLEETPDFLQETPEHDRLWFEQRPPRDFDFDE